MRARSIFIGMCVLALAGCDAPPGVGPQAKPGIGANGRRDLAGSDVDTGGEKQGKAYAAYDAFRDEKGTGLAFAGYGCESNCADIINGYQRARREKITDPRHCSGSSWGELEGCAAFAQGFPSELSSLPPLKETGAR